jgi:hypothetical protein
MFTEALDDSDLEPALARSLAESWNTRVAVRRERLDLSKYCDPAIPDFPIAMVPFWDHPAFREVDEPTRRRLLGAAWIAYNEKTIEVETDIVNPACTSLLRDELPGASQLAVKEVVAQTQVDEQFHILMCLEVCASARRRHGLERFVVPKSLLARRVQAALEAAPPRSVPLVRMAYAIVAETSINAFLRAISSDTTIQPLNRMNTELHRRDEGSHSALFCALGPAVFSRLGDGDKRQFTAYVERALADFTAPDPSAWTAVFAHLELPCTLALLPILGSLRPKVPMSRDYRALLALLDEIGMRDRLQFRFA